MSTTVSLSFDPEDPKPVVFFLSQISKLVQELSPNDEQKNRSKELTNSVLQAVDYATKKTTESFQSELKETNERMIKQQKAMDQALLKAQSDQKAMVLPNPIDPQEKDIVDFDPEYPRPPSQFLATMVWIFESAAPKDYSENLELLKRLEKASIMSHSYFLEKEKEVAAEEMERLQDELDKASAEATDNFAKATRLENQLAWELQENEKLKNAAKLQPAKTGAEESAIVTNITPEMLLLAIEQTNKNDDNQRKFAMMMTEVQLKFQIEREENERTLKYAKMQIFELQDEVKKLKMEAFEKTKEEVVKNMK